MYTRAIYDTQVNFDKARQAGVNPRAVVLAVQGLIYHFKNRNWLLGDSYTYVMQSGHRIVFNKDRPHLKYFTERLEEAEILQFVDIEHITDNETEGDAPEED